jgi:hypothetical protein
MGCAPENPIIDISINRDTGVRRAIYVMILEFSISGHLPENTHGMGVFKACSETKEAEETKP